MDWFNKVATAYRSEFPNLFDTRLSELRAEIAQRFAELDRRFAEQDASWERRLGELRTEVSTQKAELIQWVFGVVERSAQLPEWSDPHASSVPIDIRSILMHQGVAEEDADAIVRTRSRERDREPDRAITRALGPAMEFFRAGRSSILTDYTAGPPHLWFVLTDPAPARGNQ